MINNIKFINAGGILSVTGDFGNWIFCRSFIPSKEGEVSGGYWDEKLQILSQQESHKYCPQQTLKRIEEFEKEQEEHNCLDQEMKDWIEQLRDNVDDKFEYEYIAYRNKPDSVDYECVPYGKSRHQWLNIIYDGFDEICIRYKVGLIEEK